MEKHQNADFAQRETKLIMCLNAAWIFSVLIMKGNRLHTVQSDQDAVNPDIYYCDADATHNWPDEERWSEAETFSVQKQQSTPQGEHLKKNNEYNATRNVCSGDVYKPRRPGDSSHRTAGAGRGDSAGLGQVSLKVSLSFICNNTFKF